MKIPCKDCITLAACKYKEEIRCPLLYDYVMNYGGSMKDVYELLNIKIANMAYNYSVRHRATGSKTNCICIQRKQYEHTL